jgi:TATA-binding protein-associated factor Taf7
LDNVVDEGEEDEEDDEDDEDEEEDEEDDEAKDVEDVNSINGEARPELKHVITCFTFNESTAACNFNVSVQ